VATYKPHDEAAAALKALQQSGFEMKQLSLVERSHHTEADMVGFSHTGDRLKFWGEVGAVWGGMWGLIIGTGSFFIPGIGPLLVAGPLAGMIMGALEGGVVVGGLGVLGAGLYNLGIHKESITDYEAALKRGHFMVIAQGSAGETACVMETLSRTGPESLVEHPLEKASTNVGRWEHSLLP
jgi:hypothetical protein